MTISLTSPLNQANIVGWRVLAFDVNTGIVVVRFGGPGGNQSIDISCILSDTAGASSGPIVNPSPFHWDDRVIVQTPSRGAGGVGAASSLTNARNAYRAAASHGAGLKAIEQQALVDGWVDAALTGT